MQIHRVGYRIKGYSQVVKLGHLWDMTSKDALQRIKILEFAERHGQGAAIDAFEVSSRTLYRWRRALKLHNNRISALTPKSCAPHRKRPPATAPAVAAQIRAMRFHKHHPNMGKATIHASEEFRRWCRENRVALPSVSTIGRIIARAPDKMRHAPLRLGPRGQPKSVRQQHKTRRIKGYQPAPLELIAGDTIVRMRDGIRRYLTTFIDPNSRFAVAFASRTASSRQATLTLNALIDLLPAAPKYLLTDNGSEFMGDFQKRLDELHITHWWTYPNSPKMNPHAERFNRTIQESFVDYHDDLLFSDLTLFNQKLAEWLVFYNTQRPHHSLKRQSPIQYLSQQLPYCQRYWTCTRDRPAAAGCSILIGALIDWGRQLFISITNYGKNQRGESSEQKFQTEKIEQARFRDIGGRPGRYRSCRRRRERIHRERTACRLHGRRRPRG